MNKNALIVIDDALEHILQQALVTTNIEEVALSGLSGRVIAETIKAGINVPGYDNSAMDGFAVNTDFVPSPETTLAISQIIPAGKVGFTLEAGTAARIFTGAPIPDGANAIILQEDTEHDEHQVKILQVPKAGQNIRLCGHDINKAMLFW